MAFILPFPILLERTLYLDAEFSTLKERYHIFGDNLPKNQSSLDLWIARTQRVINCNTDRKEQCAVFRVLVDDLKRIPKGDKEKEGTKILIGALLHRYFRIITSYKGYSLFSSPLSSELFQAIREALQLDKKANHDNYKKSDLKCLDAMTIVSCLEMFRDYMVTKDENQKSRYEMYGHFNFKSDPDFLNNLDTIIEHHISLDNQQGSASILKQFKAIDFIQSLAKRKHIECQEFEKTFGEWSSLLMKDYPDFSQLSLVLIEKHMCEHVSSECARQKIMDILGLNFIQTKFDTGVIIDHDSFVSEMIEAHSKLASLTVIGGYAVLLRMDTISKDLKFYMRKALGIEKDVSLISNEDMLNGMDLLSDYLKSNPEINLDWRYFGGRGKFNSAFANVEIALNNEIEQEKSNNKHVVLTG